MALLEFLLFCGSRGNQAMNYLTTGQLRHAEWAMRTEN